MSAVAPRITVPTRTPPVPRLENGDRLTRAEFERRYAAMPNVKKAELIEGVVYMPSPVRLTQHGKPHAQLATWLGYYVSKTPGLDDFADNATVRFDDVDEPQPDLLLRLPERAGGRSRVGPDGYLEGPPELVAEVAASSVSLDLHAKLRAYERHGVREYLVWRVEDEAVDWFVLREGRYQPAQAEAGVHRSEGFAGLWLDVEALLKGELGRVLARVDEGVASPGHAAFVAGLRG